MAKKPPRKSVPSTRDASARATSKSARPRATRQPVAASAPTSPDDTVDVADLVDQVGIGGRDPPASQDGERPVLTTQQGIPVADDQNTLKVGERGPDAAGGLPLPREDLPLRPRAHPRARRPRPRLRRPRLLRDRTSRSPTLTRADLFQRPGERTPVFVRFSTVAGNKGSADLARDVRGFAVKFYTQEGNWDLVGNNIPVFFIQDAIKFPDLVHAVKQEPDRGFPQAQSAHDNFWDFISLMPEATHMVMWMMSDRAIPRSFRFMEGFGVHTFRLVNAAGESTFVKFHWKPKLGLQSVVWNEAVKINGADPDFHRRDLWDAIESGDFPEWELGVQVFDEAFADEFDFDVLDATKIIPEELVPVTPIGRMVLDRTVDNFFAETEQVAFCTQNVVPGHRLHQRPAAAGPQLLVPRHAAQAARRPELHAPPDQRPEVPGRPLPAGRAHGDDEPGRARQLRAELVRPGRPRAPRGPDRRASQSFPRAERGHQAARARRRRSPTTTARPGSSTSARPPIEQTHIVNAFVFELSKVEQPGIRARMVANLRNVDEDFARRIADGLGLAELPDGRRRRRERRSPTSPPSAALSILANGPATFAGRKVGVLVTDGTDAALLAALPARGRGRRRGASS